VTKRILVVDDEPVFTKLVSRVLLDNGYEVSTANDGLEALRLCFSDQPDLVLLDVSMPVMDGWQTCSRLREVSDVPIIMLTGHSTSEDDVTRGIDYGADDYLMKPVGNKALASKVRAVLRRAELPPPQESRTTYSDDYLTVDLAERQVITDGKPVKLTPTEFRLFALLLRNSGHVLTHKQLLEDVWGWEFTDDVDYVRIYIMHLRRKIESDPSHPKYIVTEAGVGYCFRRQK
jgi:two-component system KDP operon response regulator KdpE